VVDGDTITVELKIPVRVRLLDCWAPETRTKDAEEKKKGIRLAGMEPEVVNMGDGVTEDDLLFHDEKLVEPSLAYLLSRMHYPHFPEPMGVFRCVERPTYEGMLVDQINEATAAHGKGNIESLLNGGETWVVK